MLPLGEPNKSPHAVRYPWGKIFGRVKGTLLRGIDFDCLPHGMASNVRQAAARKGLAVLVRVKDDVVRYEVTGPAHTRVGRSPKNAPHPGKAKKRKRRAEGCRR